MIDTFFIAALTAALWSEWLGSRPARPLIAANALVCVLTLLHINFDFSVWLVIDVATIFAIERMGPVGKAERAIFATFPVAWMFYHLQPPGWSDSLKVIVSLQFLLTVPWDRLEQRIWKAGVA